MQDMHKQLIDPRATTSHHDGWLIMHEDEAEQEKGKNPPMAAKQRGVYAAPTDAPKSAPTRQHARCNVGLLVLLCVSFGWIAYSSFLLNQKQQEMSAVLAAQQSSISALRGALGTNADAMHARLEAAQRNHTGLLAQVQMLQHDKADVSALATGLAAKADVESVALGGQAAKADSEALADAIAESRRNHTNVEAQLQAIRDDKADASALATGLAAKADTSVLATGLAAKADALPTEAAIAESRRNSTKTQAQLQAIRDDKADASALATGLAAKADALPTEAAIAESRRNSTKTQAQLQAITDPAALAVAVSSRSPGEYAFSFSVYVTLGAVHPSPA